MAGAKRPTQRALPGTSDVARRLGISPSTLRRLVELGALRARKDRQGRYRYPDFVSQPPRKKTPAKKRAAKKTRRASATAASAARQIKKKRRPVTRPAPAAPAAKKKHSRPSALPALPVTPVRKRRSKKKATRPLKKSKKAVTRRKKVSRPPPRPQPGKKKKRGKKIRSPWRPPAGPTPPTVPGKFGAPIRDPDYVEPEPTGATPLAMDVAATMTGRAMEEYVRARFKWERDLTYLDYYGHKESFRQTYGVKNWKRTFDWIVEEWELASYIFDRTALRDS